MSPIILLGLVVMWAVVLIPMWLRRHDETEESRSVERFTSAMHTLSRREPADRRYVVMPHRSHSLDVHVSGASASARRGRLAAAFARRAARRARRAPLTAAHRRRRTLLGLVVLAVVTLLAAVLVGGTAIWALQILADVLVAGFLANLVLRARRATPARSTRTARGATARQQVRAPRRPATRPAARTRTARPARPAAEQPVEAAYQHPMVKKRSLRAGPPEVAEPAAAMPAAARQARERAMPAREGVRERAAKIVPERVRETAAVPRTRPAELQERREVLFDQTMPGYVASDDVEPTRYEPEPIEMARTAEPALEPLFDQTAPVGPVEQRETAAAYAAPDEFVFDQTAVFDDDHPTVEIDRYAEPVFDQTAEPVESRRSAEPADGELFFDLDTPQAPAAQAVTPEPEPGIGGAEWDPVPVPPPTYVNKPTAPARRARPPIFEPLLPPAETPEELDPVDNLEEILDRRWAVND